MKKIVYASFFVLLICSYTFAQDVETNEESKCPTFEIVMPKTSVKKGVEMKFTLEIDGDYDKEKVKIGWLTDKGKIVSGQNTSSISVVVDVEGDMSLNAIAYIDGLPEQCQGLVSETLLCSHCGKDNELIFYYELGKIDEEELKDWIDKFWIELKKDKSLTGYLILYGTPEEIGSREDIVRKHSAFRKYDSSKLILVNGGTKKSYRTRLWLAPPKADFSKIN